MRYANNYSSIGFPSFSRLFEDFFGSDFMETPNKTQPAVNIKESESGFELELAVPGLSKEDIKVEVEKNVLKVKAAKSAANPEETTKYLRREFHYTSFERAFTLPDAVDTTKIVANYEQGVLSLNLPKYEAEVMPGAKLIDIV